MGKTTETADPSQWELTDYGPIAKKMHGSKLDLLNIGDNYEACSVAGASVSSTRIMFMSSLFMCMFSLLEPTMVENLSLDIGRGACPISSWYARFCLLPKEGLTPSGSGWRYGGRRSEGKPREKGRERELGLVCKTFLMKKLTWKKRSLLISATNTSV